MIMNKKVFDTIEKIANDMGVYIHDVVESKNRSYVECNFETDFGQDAYFIIDYNQNETDEQELLYDFGTALYEYYQSYDVSYETSLWIDETGHGKNGAPYEIEDIVADMKQVESTIKEFSEKVLAYYRNCIRKTA